MASLLALHERGVDDDSRFPGSAGENRPDYLLCGLLRDRLAAVRTVGNCDGSVEDSEVVVYLGHGSDDGARVAACRSLLDGDRRGKTLDLLDVGLLHAVEELPRVGGERLDVAALPFRVESVEGKRRLAASRKPRNNSERVAGNRYVDPPQVVNPSILDYYVH